MERGGLEAFRPVKEVLPRGQLRRNPGLSFFLFSVRDHNRWSFLKVYL